MADLAPAKSTDFVTARLHYEQLRAIGDAVPDECRDRVGNAFVSELAMELWAPAMDHLIEAVPAPDREAFNYKLSLVKSRCENGDGFRSDDIFGTYWLAILRDIAALGGACATDVAKMLEARP